MTLERRTPVLYPIGIILLSAGVISFCTGNKISTLPDSKPTGKHTICAGASEIILNPGRYESISLNTACWTAAVKTTTGRGQIQTDAKTGEQYVAYCSNGAQFNARGTTYWYNQSNCPIPIYFRAIDRPITLFARQTQE